MYDKRKCIGENNNMEEKKTCFVVTPIGDESTDIRRHIDGIIDQAIIPAINKEFDVKVAHREYEVGSINDRVIRRVYDSDLVIANLTTLNPNVMFELAIRYSFGKPTIVIAEKGTKLPFDIIDENTIFYINDPAGAAELKETIKRFVEKLDWNNSTYGPVYSAINKAAMLEKIETGVEEGSKAVFSFLVQKIEHLEKEIKSVFLNAQSDNDLFNLDMVNSAVYDQKIDFQIRWEEIKSRSPFDLEEAEQLLSEIRNYVDFTLGLKTWDVTTQRYIKGKFSFLEQEIKNYIFNEKKKNT